MSRKVTRDMLANYAYLHGELSGGTERSGVDKVVAEIRADGYKRKMGELSVPIIEAAVKCVNYAHQIGAIDIGTPLSAGDGVKVTGIDFPKERVCLEWQRGKEDVLGGVGSVDFHFDHIIDFLLWVEHITETRIEQVKAAAKTPADDECLRDMESLRQIYAMLSTPQWEAIERNARDAKVSPKRYLKELIKED